jgi:SAM-dependent methyltransferase
MTSRFGGYELHSFIAEYYDTAYNRRNDKDVSFYVDYSKKANGRTLELGCGTGRILIPTAAAGCGITGLDLSTFMLNKCREKLTKQPEEVQKRVKLIQGNMTDFKTGEKYSLITLPFRAFQHLIMVEEQKTCLNCIREHLRLRGLLIIDIYNPNPARLIPGSKFGEEIGDLPETPLPDGRTVRRASRMVGLHRDQQFNDIELIYYVTHPDSRTERLVQSFPMRYYYRYEMEHLLVLCGFKIFNLFGDFDGSAFSADSPEMIFIAGKRSKTSCPS